MVAGWTKRAMIEAWADWHGAWEENKELKGKLRRALRKMTHRAVSAAFDNWRGLLSLLNHPRTTLAPYTWYAGSTCVFHLSHHR